MKLKGTVLIIVSLVLLGSCDDWNRMMMVDEGYAPDNSKLSGKTFYLDTDDSVSISCGKDTTTLTGWVWQQYEGTFESYTDLLPDITGTGRENVNALCVRVSDKKILKFYRHSRYINDNNDLSYYLTIKFDYTGMFSGDEPNSMTLTFIGWIERGE